MLATALTDVHHRSFAHASSSYVLTSGIADGESSPSTPTLSLRLCDGTLTYTGMLPPAQLTPP